MTTSESLLLGLWRGGAPGLLRVGDDARGWPKLLTIPPNLLNAPFACSATDDLVSVFGFAPVVAVEVRATVADI